MVMKETGPVDTDRLVEDQRDLMYHLIRRNVHDRGAHEEIFQEVFVNTLKSLPRFEGRSKLSTWIASIAVHTCYQFIHRTGKQERVESYESWLERRPEPGSSPDVQKELERAEDWRRLERHLQELAPMYALPITLFYLEGSSYGEIAGILGIPLGTVKSHLFRGLGELRKKMEGGSDEHLHG